MALVVPKVKAKAAAANSLVVVGWLVGWLVGYSLRSPLLHV